MTAIRKTSGVVAAAGVAAAEQSSIPHIEECRDGDLSAGLRYR